jgi:SNF2 family DNA or RNA helicase
MPIVNLGAQVQQLITAPAEATALQAQPLPESLRAALKTTLLPHQTEAVAWMRQREHALQPVRGGVLADDMGLGKSLTVIATLLSQQTIGGDPASAAAAANTCQTTLLVCPASLVQQWHAEFAQHVHALPDEVVVTVYHGAGRTLPAKRVLESASVHVILTTYGVVQAGDAALQAVGLHRLVLDEAHVIKNAKSKTFAACHAIAAPVRWLVTGSPLNNNLDEVGAFFAFLRVAPLDTRAAWRREIAAHVQGPARLGALLASLQLRRLKTDTRADGTPLLVLPTRTEVKHLIDLAPDTQRCFDKIFARTAKLYARNGGPVTTPPHNILQRLLYLRLLACHPALARACSVALGLGEETERLVAAAAAAATTTTATAAAATTTKPESKPDPMLDALTDSLAALTLPQTVVEQPPASDATGLEDLLGSLSLSTPVAKDAPDSELEADEFELLESVDSLPRSEKEQAMFTELAKIRAADPAAKIVLLSQFTKFLDIVRG